MHRSVANTLRRRGIRDSSWLPPFNVSANRRAAPKSAKGLVQSAGRRFSRLPNTCGAADCVNATVFLMTWLIPTRIVLPWRTHHTRGGIPGSAPVITRANALMIGSRAAAVVRITVSHDGHDSRLTATGCRIIAKHPTGEDRWAISMARSPGSPAPEAAWVCRARSTLRPQARRSSCQGGVPMS